MSTTTTAKEASSSQKLPPIFGAIVGDVAGSYYELHNCKSESCEIFMKGSRVTDDSVLTLATACRFLTPSTNDDDEEEVSKLYSKLYSDFGKAYPKAGYGGTFRQWMKLPDEERKPYNSWGNGSAMRASPIGWVASSMDEALKEASRSAGVTHNHPTGIRGAQAAVAAIFLARQGSDKDTIKNYIEDQFGYDLNRTINEIRPSYEFDASCDGSVPEAIIAFLESSNFEDAIRKAISLGGDSDTIASIAGAIAQAYYGIDSIPFYMVECCRQKMKAKQREVNDEFWKKYYPGNLD